MNSPYAIEATNLCFKYRGPVNTVNNIDLKIEKGCIYGFIGPNGAGKTTTIRLLLGLLKPSKGAILLMGKSLANHRIELLKNIGAMIETPSLYEHLSGYENIDIARRLKGLNRNSTSRVLEQVQLMKDGKRKVKEYSLGMKQRLALAIALLAEPKLLILDEPTNGFDPHGIIETRTFLKELNKNHGTTILISSHILSEVEKLVTHVGIIHKGNLKFQGAIETIRQQQRAISSVVFSTNDSAKAITMIPRDYKPRININGSLEISVSNIEDIPKICKQLVTSEISIYQIIQKETSLEKIFIELTSQ